MRIRSLLFASLFLVCFADAGTPAVNGTAILYGIPLILLIALIGVPLLIKYIKKRRELLQHNQMEDIQDPGQNGED